MRRFWWLLLALLVAIPTVQAMRTRKPPTFTNLQDPNQLVELNSYLADLHELTNGRYTLENLTTDPQDTRKGQKGDLVYASFGGGEHLCVNTSFPTGMEWTCVNVGLLSDCPGGADTSVQFNDNGDCGGDISFLFDKNLDHAALDGDGTATVDEAVTEDGDSGSRTAFEALNVSDSITDFTSATRYGILGRYTWNPSSATGATQAVRGVAGMVNYTGAGLLTASSLVGVYGQSIFAGTNTSTNGPIYAAGVYGRGEQNGSGRLGTISGGAFIAGTSLASSGNVTNLIGISVIDPYKSGSGTISNSYGINVSNLNSPATDNFGVSIFTGTNNTGVTGDVASIISDADMRVADGNTVADNGFNQFLTPAITGVSGGGSEVLTRASTVYIQGAPTQGSNVTVSDASALLSDTQTRTLASAQTLAFHGHNQFLAPTLNGVAGGGTETVTDAATVFIDAAPSGSNISILSAADLMFGESTSTAARIKVQNETSANTAGRSLNIDSANGLGSGVGGNVTITSGTGGATGAGGDITLFGGDGGATSGTGGEIFLFAGDGTGSGAQVQMAAGDSTTGDGGDAFLISGEATAGTGSGGDVFVTTEDGVGGGGNIFLSTGRSTGANGDGGPVTVSLGNQTGSGLPSYFLIGYDTSPADTTTLAKSILLIDNDTTIVADGTTIANWPYVEIDRYTANGVAGGGTETITNGSTVKIVGPPTGSNITFTNGPYALWSDSGTNRFDGLVEAGANLTVTGIVVVDAGTTAGTLKLDGNVGGCLMFRDTDDAGWTECDALNGTLSCSIDADGLCD